MKETNRILFVDDDELILLCFARVLGQRFTLDVAWGSAEALRMIDLRGPYAVVVSDMSMPGMSGLELLKRAKQAAPETIGLLMSGNAESEALENAVRDGIVLKVLQKPFDVKEMIATLEEALVQYEGLQRCSHA